MTSDSSQSAQEMALAETRAVGEALRLAVAWLRAAGVETPELDAQVLLAHVAEIPRASLIAFPERALAPEQAQTYAALAARRATHEPVAYLTGHREFMGLDLLTDARALIPRPETELLVEAALSEIRARLARGEAPVVADIGTGSGAIALAVAVHEPRLPRIFATDVSREALALAQTNAERLGVADRLTFVQGDLLTPLTEPLDVLLANLPYIAPQDAPALPMDVRQYEPARALYGADDGLGHLRSLFAQLRETPTHLNPGATLILEYGYDQRAVVAALAQETLPGSTLRPGSDYAGWDRYVIILTPGPSPYEEKGV